MPLVELFDETLDINSTENYELSVELSPDVLTFCILDTLRNKFIMLRSAQPDPDKRFSTDDLTKLIRQDDFLTKSYKRINIIHPSLKFTIIPSLLFDPGKKDEYFLFNHSLEDNQVIQVNKLSEPESFLLYSQFITVSEMVNTVWPGANNFHHLKPYFDNIIRSRQDTDDFLHLHIEHDFFNLVLFGKNIMKFCNSFVYRSVSDILYYTLNCIKSLEIQQNVTIVLSGLNAKNNDIQSNLAMYMRNIKFAKPAGNFTFSYAFNESELFRFINLISAVNCG
jgi:hypothetical protein